MVSTSRKKVATLRAGGGGGKEPHRLRELLHRLLVYSNRDSSRQQFLRQACGILLEFSGCDAIEVRVDDAGKTYACRVVGHGEGKSHVECRTTPSAVEEREAAEADGGPIPERLVTAVLMGHFAAAAPFFTRGGSFWTGDTASPILIREAPLLREQGARSSKPHTLVVGGEFLSLALIPVPVERPMRGVLFLGSRERDFFGKEEVQLYETVAETLGVALAHRDAQWALRERIKELTCLYGISRLLQHPGLALDEVLRRTVEIIPQGWQYPEVACARILVDGRYFATPGFEETPFRQRSELVVNGERRGAVEVVYSQHMPECDEGPFLAEERRLLDAVAETLGTALARHGAESALRERVKELTCLYGISSLVQQNNRTWDEVLAGIANLLPQSWQFPDVAHARITIDGRAVSSAGFREGVQRQRAEIVAKGQPRGAVEVVYSDQMPPADEGPFLSEERSLIDEVARQVGLLVERHEAGIDKSRLEQQLLRADRLATIGQLSAGIAHELNEPLGTALGFAQLAKSHPGLPNEVVRDMEKIEAASLHARDIIRKLLVFARVSPMRKAPFDLNRLVQDELSIIESRCAKDGIRLARNLDPCMPPLIADRSQVHQVLVNLVVNAVQAVSRGGQVNIDTKVDGEEVVLVVSDDGAGMDEATLKKVFVPFFTTKEPGKGTGLGLSVVHGIVSSHGGTVHVDSAVGKGSRFEVRFPLHPSEEVA
jgi:two-component system, NtrC family, sensor kinase